MHLYGIAHCDTIKKARLWLTQHQQDYRFHDYKKEGVAVSLLSTWAEQTGWEKLLNRSGMTWRKLPEDIRAGITDPAAAFVLMAKHTSLIKRPVLVHRDRVIVGFDEAVYTALFLDQCRQT